VNEAISELHYSKSTGNKYNGFCPATSPFSKIKPMNLSIQHSSPGKAIRSA
jgi:hypothetical protein